MDPDNPLFRRLAESPELLEQMNTFDDDPEKFIIGLQMQQFKLTSGQVPQERIRDAQSPDDRPPPYDATKIRSGEEIVRDIRRYKAWYEKDSKRKPIPALFQDPSNLLLDSYWERNADRKRRQYEHTLCVTPVGIDKHCSTTPLERLQRIPLDHMFSRKLHKGNYLLCRTISLPTRATSISINIQDPEGNVVCLGLYNYPTVFNRTLEYLDTLFPRGTILVIREPRCKPNGPYFTVCVDTPSDVIFLSPTDALLEGVSWKTGPKVIGSLSIPTNAEAWKLHGNALFKTEKWLPSAVAYSYGIKLDPAAITLRLNRSEAYLRLGYFSGALSDAQYVLGSAGVEEKHRQKAMYRAGRAEYERGNYKHAMKLFQICLVSNPNDKEIISWIARSKDRLEETLGNYDWIKLFGSSQINGHLDIGDYKGPIEVRQIPNRGGGRGIVATEDIAVGELLLVSKPFMCVFEQEVEGDILVVALDVLGEQVYKHPRSALCSRIAEKLYGNPELRDAVFDLYAGSTFPEPPSTYSHTPVKNAECVDALSSSIDIDISRLEAICLRNCFSFSPMTRYGDTTTKEMRGSSLYLLASLFNHSCVPNAHSIIIGDTKFVRAIQNIKIGEEITTTYVYHKTYIPREKHLKHFLPSLCECWLCQEDRKDGQWALQRRHELLDNFETQTLDQLRALESTMDATYTAPRGAVRHELGLIQTQIAEKYRRKRKRTQSIAADIRALTSFGFVVLDDAGRQDGELPIATFSLPTTTGVERSLGIMIALAQDHLHVGRRNKAVKWLRAAQWVVSMVVGGEKELFIYLARPLLQQRELLEFAKEVL